MHRIGGLQVNRVHSHFPCLPDRHYALSGLRQRSATCIVIVHCHSRHVSHSVMAGLHLAAVGMHLDAVFFPALHVTHAAHAVLPTRVHTLHTLHVHAHIGHGAYGARVHRRHHRCYASVRSKGSTRESGA